MNLISSIWWVWILLKLPSFLQFHGCPTSVLTSSRPAPDLPLPSLMSNFMPPKVPFRFYFFCVISTIDISSRFPSRPRPLETSKHRPFLSRVHIPPGSLPDASRTYSAQSFNLAPSHHFHRFHRSRSLPDLGNHGTFHLAYHTPWCLSVAGTRCVPLLGQYFALCLFFSEFPPRCSGCKSRQLPWWAVVDGWGRWLCSIGSVRCKLELGETWGNGLGKGLENELEKRWAGKRGCVGRTQTYSVCFPFFPTVSITKSWHSMCQLRRSGTQGTPGTGVTSNMWEPGDAADISAVTFWFPFPQEFPKKFVKFDISTFHCAVCELSVCLPLVEVW